MTTRCHACGQPLCDQGDLAARIEATEREIRALCERNGLWISPVGGRVRESTAAMVLGISEGHLANLRGEGHAPPHTPAGFGRGGVSYAIRDLAEHIEAGRVTT